MKNIFFESLFFFISLSALSGGQLAGLDLHSVGMLNESLTLLTLN